MMKKYDIIKGRVSIIVPCFNGEGTLPRCLDSLLSQSYTDLEIVFVNDGSTDRSGLIAKQYMARFKARGMSFIYVEQANAGLGGAINTGLKYFSGEYLCWGDVDDFWYSDSVRIRKTFLDENPQYGSVSSDAHVYDEGDLLHPIGKASEDADRIEEENQFLNHLNGRPLFCPGCHMLRVSAFDYANPKREIYTARHGQNNQLLMPVYYHFKHKYIPIPLYGYVIYSKSMSHGQKSKKDEMERLVEYYAMMEHTIKEIEMPVREKREYLKMNKKRELDDMSDFAAKYHDKKLIYKCYFLKRFYNV